MARVDFPRPRELNVRVPRGTEAGANSQWMPGGYLPRGQLEAVLGLGAAKPGVYTTTPVVAGEKGQRALVRLRWIQFPKDNGIFFGLSR